MAYFTNWYHLPHKTALGLVLIISRSSVVIKITAGKLIQLSLMTFGDVSINFCDIKQCFLKVKPHYLQYPPLHFYKACVL